MTKSTESQTESSQKITRQEQKRKVRHGYFARPSIDELEVEPILHPLEQPRQTLPTAEADITDGKNWPTSIKRASK
jgi:hypothetical protein